MGINEQNWMKMKTNEWKWMSMNDDVNANESIYPSNNKWICVFRKGLRQQMGMNKMKMNEWKRIPMKELVKINNNEHKWTTMNTNE